MFITQFDNYPFDPEELLGTYCVRASGRLDYVF
jgi:hypothetical protein